MNQFLKSRVWQIPAFMIAAVLLMTVPLSHSCWAQQPELTDGELKLALAFEQRRIDAIDQVVNSVVAIYNPDRSGGGSGVVITPSGLALTNHHVIVGAGVEGWGGMAGDKLFRWELIGTDPGGDVSLIQMFPRDEDGDDFEFPFTPLGDSDKVQVGNWALAMGNPFILTEDQYPTVTLGIVSGVQRYQSGAGKNQLVYGNCIQVDSSINPGNSGGPLFNFSGEVIGINGRGSFQDRGRVNVGLGYAISANQIRNFIPELLATKLVEHGTLDANFSDRGGKVVCSTLSSDSPAKAAGLALGDEMLEFEGQAIDTANHFTNLICTLPAGWPAQLKIRKDDGSELSITVRLPGLPYAKTKRPRVLDRRKKKGEKESPPTEKEKEQMRKMELARVMTAQPGTVRKVIVNRKQAKQWVRQWQPSLLKSREQCWQLQDTVTAEDGSSSPMTMWICADGRFLVETESNRWCFNGDEYLELGTNAAGNDDNKEQAQSLTPREAKQKFEILQAIVVSAGLTNPCFSSMGDILIDGSDRCAGENACRFLLADLDDAPLYFWMTGSSYSESKPQLRKCATSTDCIAGGVMLDNWQPFSTDDGKLEIALTRKQVVGLEEKVTNTITNDQITNMPLKEFEQLLNEQTITQVDSDE